MASCPLRSHPEKIGVSVHILSVILDLSSRQVQIIPFMARNIRIEYAGAFYHVMARGNRREAIFLDDDDRRFFLKCLAEACGRTGWLVHAWVLMGNHYHLFVETPEANLVDGMKWLQNTVTRRFNVRHQEWGRLFGDRYKAVLVEADSAQYYTTLWEYLHLNPCRAGLVDLANSGSILDYRWSSVAGGYALPPGQRPKWLAAVRGLAIMGFPDTAKGRRELVEHLDQRGRSERQESGFVPVADGADRRTSHLQRGWYWGHQEFAERILKAAGKTLGKRRCSRAYQTSPERMAHGTMTAKALIDEGLKVAGLNKHMLAELPANDPKKILLADLVWRETSVGQDWIAEALGMKTAANVSLALHRANWKKIGKLVPAGLSKFAKKCKNMHADP